MTTAQHYVAGAYLVALILVLAYVVSIALKLQRLERALDDLSFPDENGVQEPSLEQTSSSAPMTTKHDAVETRAG